MRASQPETDTIATATESSAKGRTHARRTWWFVVGWLAGAVAAGLPWTARAQQQGQPDVAAQVAAMARDLASKPYAAPNRSVPEILANLDLRRYHDIRFRTEHTLWRDDPQFTVQYFPRGFLFRERVQIYVVDDKQVRELPFDRSMFDFGNAGLATDQVPPDLGFAGFRVLYPLNRADHRDEVTAFLGASYFRMLGRNQVYGLSARGLALDTALPEGEEFPLFRAFWLVRPDPKATTMTIHALLDSESLTGAYRFVLQPGAGTTVEVKATLFARRDVRKLGIAPLTSMFLYGENSIRYHDSYRPEIHDSDGLLVRSGRDEWIWRPLTNPRKLRVTSLIDEAPRGFGLLQRDRAFDRYLDLHGAYERRPSIWVEPNGNTWGKGAVQLVEIPSRAESDDNIVAFWVPDQVLKAGEERTISYRLRAFASPMPGEAMGYVVRTHNGRAEAAKPKAESPRRLRHFIVDFHGGELAALDGSQPVTGQLATSAGTTSEFRVSRLPGGTGWRAAFRLAPDGAKPADMRLYLDLRGRRLTETWSYVWYPDELE